VSINDDLTMSTAFVRGAYIHRAAPATVPLDTPWQGLLMREDSDQEVDRMSRTLVGITCRSRVSQYSTNAAAISSSQLSLLNFLHHPLLLLSYNSSLHRLYATNCMAPTMPHILVLSCSSMPLSDESAEHRLV
jgi:hypothetical protein